MFFHSLIFLFLKLGSQSKDWLFFYLWHNRNVKAFSRKVERHKSIV